MKEERVPDNEDYKLVSLCKNGETDAFEVLVERHQKKMLNIAYRMIGNYEDACEVVQDAFVSAYKNIKGFEGKARFSTWLYSIVVNLSRNRLKQLHVRRSREEYSLDDPLFTEDGHITKEHSSAEPSALDRLERKDVRQKVQGCIDSMDGEFKEVLILRDVQGFSYEEVSEMLKLPGGTVKSRLSRARGVLRDCLKKTLGAL